MRKKIIKLILMGLINTFIIGCGGGSSSGDVAENTAYLNDSPVIGLNYKCGTNEGITGDNGSFVYSNNDETCIFTLGNKTVFEINTSDLIPKGMYFVKETQMMQLLQNLDYDGDITNGIQIQDNVKKIIEENLTILDQNYTTIANIIKQKDANFTGNTYTQTEAENNENDYFNSLLKTNYTGTFTLTQGSSNCYKEGNINFILNNNEISGYAADYYVEGSVSINGISAGIAGGGEATWKGVLSNDGTFSGTYENKVYRCYGVWSAKPSD
jgi:hypothetical protein